MDQKALDEINEDQTLREQVMRSTRVAIENADKDPEAARKMQSGLAIFFDYQFSVPDADRAGRFFGGLPADMASALVRGLFAQEEAYFDPKIVADIPNHGKEFVVWLRDHIHSHRIFTHPIYDPFITKEATCKNLKVIGTLEKR